MDADEQLFLNRLNQAKKYINKLERVKMNLLTSQEPIYVVYRKKYYLDKYLDKYLAIPLMPELICKIAAYEDHNYLDKAARAIYFSKDFV